MAIIRDRDLIQDEIPIALIVSCINEHQADIPRLNKLDEYYQGEHDVLKRKRSSDDLPNNKLISNHAKYITDVAAGYFIGNPVKYDGEQIDDIIDVYDKADVVSHDTELEKDLSIFGRGLELGYMTSDDPPMPNVSVIDPRNIFLVVDDTVEHKPMFGVHYYEKRDIDNEITGWNINVYDESNIYRYFADEINSDKMTLQETESQYFGIVPIIEYSNNEEQQGDFEQQISLIDAYNLLQSDRINDKEQFVDAILKVVGFSFGDDFEQASKTVRMLKELRVLEIPSSGTGDKADADWLVKQLDEGNVEILRKAIKSDIHEFSMVPNLTDESFASNASGVAMKYKLFGLEQLCVIKERYFVQGLRERLKLFANILAVKGKAVDVSDVTITMTRNLPANDLETAQLITQLDGNVSNETLISQLSFIDDPAAEIDKLNEQKDNDARRIPKEFGMPMGEGLDDGDEE